MRIKIENFKAVNKPIEITDTGINIITGANGSGKSSITQAIRLLKDNLLQENGKISIKSFLKLDLSKIGLTNFGDLVNKYSGKNEIIFTFTITDHDNFLFRKNKKALFVVELRYRKCEDIDQAQLSSLSIYLKEEEEYLKLISFSINHIEKQYINIEYFKENLKNIQKDVLNYNVIEPFIVNWIGYPNVGFVHIGEKNLEALEQIQKHFIELEGISKVIECDPHYHDMPIFGIVHKNGTFPVYWRENQPELDVIKQFNGNTLYNYALLNYLRDKQNLQLKDLIPAELETNYQINKELIVYLNEKEGDKLSQLIAIEENEILMQHFVHSFDFQQLKIFDKYIDYELFSNLNPLKRYLLDQLKKTDILHDKYVISLSTLNNEKRVENQFDLFRNYINAFLSKVLSYITSELSFIRYFDGVNVPIKRFYDKKDEIVTDIIAAKNWKGLENPLWKDFVQKWINEFNIGQEINFIYTEGRHQIQILDKNQWMNLVSLGAGKAKLLLLIITIANSFLNEEIQAEGYTANNWFSLQLDFPFPTILILEEPEAFLHPNFQSKLADLFVDVANPNKSGISMHSMFIIETHSEYLIRKLQLIRATKGISQLSLFYFGNNENWEIKIDEQGRLSRPFGSGFFDEADEIATALFYHVNDKLN